MSPFCGATDTPVSDFWWRLLRVFKARVGSALFELSGGICVTLHIPWDSPLVRHLPTSWWPAWQPGHLFHVPARHWWDSKVGAIMPPLTVWDQADTLPTELSRLSPHSVRPGRRSTDWAIPAQPSQCEMRQTLYRLSYPGSALRPTLNLENWKRLNCRNINKKKRRIYRNKAFHKFSKMQEYQYCQLRFSCCIVKELDQYSL